MKNTFVSKLTELRKKDHSIMLLTGDLGFNTFENFQKEYPQSFFNMGIAEQNMIGVGAGLAIKGFKPYIYSIIPFIAFRALEQIRNDLCYPKLNVKLIGVGTGYSYGQLGFSHHSIEDIGILKAIPNITIISPTDCLELDYFLNETKDYLGPVYIRLGKTENRIGELPTNFKIGSPRIIKKGKDILILTHGDILEEVINSDYNLFEKGINPTIATLPVIKPLNIEFIEPLFNQHKFVFVVEENSIIGSLYESLKSIFSQNKIFSISVNDKYFSKAGDKAFCRKSNGLDAKSITDKILFQIKK